MAEKIARISFQDTLKTFKPGDTLNFTYDEIRTVNNVVASTIYNMKKTGKIPAYWEFRTAKLPNNGLMVSRFA